MARVNPIQRDELELEEEREAFDHVVGTRGRVHGPFTMLIRSPELGKLVADLGEYARQLRDVPRALQCLAVLNVSRIRDCRYEWAAWVNVSREAGVREDVIDALRQGRRPEGMTRQESLVYDLGVELLGPTQRVSQETYDGLIEEFGLRVTVELVAMHGYFLLLTCVLNTFEVDVPEGWDLLPV